MYRIRYRKAQQIGRDEFLLSVKVYEMNLFIDPNELAIDVLKRFNKLVPNAIIVGMMKL